MALFGDDPSPVRPRRRGSLASTLLALGILGLAALGFTPSPYIIDAPGPVYDTLGEVRIDGEVVPLIDIPDETTYPTEGSLSLLTVSAIGTPSQLPTWWEVFVAWLDPARAVAPVDLVYPPGFSFEESREQNRVLMENSQKDAVAAALTYLGHEFHHTITVDSLAEDSPAEGILREGDRILAASGIELEGVDHLRALIAENGTSSPLGIEIERDGAIETVEVTPRLAASTQADGTVVETPVIGVYLSIDYEFPITVDIQLQNVGGPSGGQMFALGIIDKLTPGALTGGAEVAGTGTITGTGEVGSIGGIVQKLHGAADAGAEVFLAPIGNCDEVVGNVPPGLSVIAVTTLDDAVSALEAIASGADPATLPSCERR